MRTAKKANNNIAVEPVSGGVTAPKGFLAAGMAAGIKASGKPDLAMLVSAVPAAGAGMFTTNAVRAACVEQNENALPSQSVRAIVCNSGNANACTGKRGEKDAARTAASAAAALGAAKDSVLVASTGVIGQFLPMDKITNAMPALAKSLSQSGGTAFAEAIMTTDLTMKEAAVRVTFDGGQSFVVGAAAKGSGMIHPNMATMLCFIATDAGAECGLLNKILKRAVDSTFNNLTVDGDTSTNDMVLAMANGESGISVTKNSPSQEALELGIRAVCADLCKKIAADGEGATKRVEITVKGAKSEIAAKVAAKAVANSNLTKCALFGNDPNWGRIACAVGYSGAAFNKKKFTIDLCGARVFEKMMPTDFDAAEVHKRMKRDVVEIGIYLGKGNAEAVVQTCDLSYDYVKINAEYRT